jgi:hypothetical protein
MIAGSSDSGSAPLRMVMSAVGSREHEGRSQNAESRRPTETILRMSVF